ncbi:hypothetical protein MMC11_005387 [Xylographa trunciseda]|nr:hypothetical protein [Xylographa trunciseda]
MVTVALAGAGGLGMTILKAILNSKKHKVVLLSRAAKPELSAQGVEVHAVDYNDHESLVKALRGVHTIISTIAAYDSSWVTSQLAILKAAKEVGVKRFAPSEFAGMKAASFARVDLYIAKGPVWEATKASGLEYTNFATGLFMNAFVTGTPRGQEEALEGLRPWNFVVNVKLGNADIPGDGNAKVTMTTMGDVGKFVTAALDLEKWEEEMGMVGEDLTFNEVVAITEKVTKRKFLVKYKSFEELDELADNSPDFIVKFANQIQRAMAKGGAIVPPTLNNKFPEIVPWRLEAWLEKWWGGVELGEPIWGDGKMFQENGNWDGLA